MTNHHILQWQDITNDVYLADRIDLVITANTSLSLYNSFTSVPPITIMYGMSTSVIEHV